MSIKFDIPASWTRDPVPPPQPPDLSGADPHRIEAMVNDFIAAKQDALFTAPDAFYRQTGADAVDGAPPLLQRLAGLRDATLAQARDDGERAMLGPRLDLHIDDARDGIDRHVTQQQDALTRQTIAERQRLIQRAAELDHNNDDKLAGLAEAHASAAKELARLNGAPEEPAAQSARSAIWRTALAQRLAAGDQAQALTLFDRIKDQIAPDDRRHVELPIRLAATDIAADRWIERATAAPGESLPERAAADPDLSPAEKASVLSKIAERTSATESARFATVKGLDDRFDAAHRALATAPASYKPATFVTLANAYEDAGEPDKAAAARRLAEQETVLGRFARSSVAQQRRLIDVLPPDAQDSARAIQRQQADAFAHDPYAAGTALYPEVGPTLPAEDEEGRRTQERMIAAQRDIPTDELLTRVNALPEDMNAADLKHEQIAQAGPQESEGGTRRKAEELLRKRNTPIVPWETAKEKTDQNQIPLVDHEAADREFKRQQSLPGAPRVVTPEKEETLKPLPQNDPSSEEWAGSIVDLPDGSLIEDPFDDRRNYTGYVMAPTNNLKEVAQAGREDGARYQAQVADPLTASDAESFKGVLLFGKVGTLGKFDTQREGNQLLGILGATAVTQHRQFLPIANINVGLYCQQFGLTLDETLKLAGLWARLTSSNYDPDSPYGLNKRPEHFIRKGYEIGQSGQFDSKPSPEKQP